MTAAQFWIAVRHSGYGYGDDPTFKRGLEERSITKAQAIKYAGLGGAVFADYSACSDFCDAEMYPDGAGMVPNAPGGFAESVIDGLHMYVPATRPDGALTVEQLNEAA